MPIMEVIPGENTPKKSNGKANDLIFDYIPRNEPFLTTQLEKDLWKIRINKMVRAAKDIAASHWAVPILLIVILSYWVYSDQKATKVIDTKDLQIEQIKKELQEQTRMLTRLDTLREVDEKQKQTDKEAKERQIEIDQAWRENIKQEFNALRAELKGKNGNGRN